MSSTECPIGFREINGKFCFAKGTKKKTFAEATVDCQQLGGFLVEPRSEEISDVITSFDFRPKPFFIGLKNANNGIFLWQTDGAALSYEDWEDGQPDNGDGDQQYCVQMNNNDRWNVCRCTEELDYLCQATKGKFYPFVLEFIRKTNRLTFEDCI